MALLPSLTIKAKVIAVAVFVVLVIAAAASVVMQEMGAQRGHLADVNRTAQTVVKQVVPLTGHIAEIRYDVAQVQQWLTDISATRAQDGLDDGEKKAAEFAAKFDEASTAALGIARSLGLPEVATALEGTRKNFVPYYEVGQRMAHAYIEGGPPAGNTLMGDFDKVAGAMEEDMARLLETMDGVREQRLSGLGTSIAEIEETAETLSRMLIAAAAVVFFLVAACVVFLLGAVLGPMGRLRGTMAALADGNLDITVGFEERRDEIGQMAGAVQVFKENAVAKLRMEAEQEAARTRAERERQKAVQDMAATIEQEAAQAVEAVATKTRQMTRDAEGMAGSAERVSENAHSVAAAAEQALSNAQTVASATEQLSASIREISAQVAQSTAVTRRAVDDGQKTQATIKSLSEAVGRIGEVASLIGDIAGQTNLLALNATIEAARAGEAGKGFAIVASEVKNLANQTARSTEEITRQISEIQAVTATTVEAVDGIGRTIGEIDGISSMIAAAMEEQASATQEISRNVVETTQASQEVSRRIAAVSEEAGATGEQATHIRQNSDEVAGSIQELRQVLVRVVRTSTRDADRRRKPRYRVDEPCTLQIGGAQHKGTVHNLSEGGALLDGLPPTAPGVRGTLSLDRHGLRVDFEVKVAENAGAHVKFASGQPDAFHQGFVRITQGMRPLDAAA